MNLFKRKKKTPAPESVPIDAVQSAVSEPEPPAPATPEKRPDDDLTEWYRTPTRGGIERRERNDIYEEYCVYGADQNGALICRRWHRYPEHEREFDLSYSRALTFDEFNRRLLCELDKGGMKLADYRRCIGMAERLTGADDTDDTTDLSDSDKQLLEAFCESMDTFINKQYLHGEGALSCECESVVGGEIFQLRFRKPLKHDAIDAPIAGVSKKPVEGYELDNLWVMSIYNRLRDRCTACRITQLTFEWSIGRESIRLFCADGFDGIDGALIAAVGSPSDMSRFGFYSLDFSAK